MEKKMTGKIEKKLDILIKLVASNMIKEDSTQTESILRLNKLGIRNKDIAEILNSTENYVNLIISKSKKKDDKKQRK
ncbi:hypothetical protein HYT56_02150 [Candidatus Woesearchaeota archaeon]|nr:hypothetical protein [Candidatus Woesearchaeota archaeon]